MAIKIETKKVVPGNGVESREILHVEALKEKELPSAYRWSKNRPTVYMGAKFNGTRFLILKVPSGSDEAITCGNTIEEQKFQEIITLIHAAGEHLADINRELARKREEWNGAETFVI